MLKKILKWTGIVLGSIIALLIIFYAVVYFSTQSRINKTYDVKAQQLTIPTDSASYARGRHIAEIRGCMGCHGKNLGGHEAFLPEGSAPGTLYAPNITSGKGGIQYNDEDWIRVLRHGVNKEGTSVWFMPSQEICHISNQELGELLCYIKKQPPVDNAMPAKEIKPLGRLLVFLDKFPLLPAEKIDHNAAYKDAVVAEVSVAYGGYLTTSCKGCHGETFKGNPPIGEGLPPIPDLTLTGEIGKWSETDFLHLFHTGKKPDGTELSAAMPVKEFTYTNDELKAIYAYFHQLK